MSLSPAFSCFSVRASGDYFMECAFFRAMAIFAIRLAEIARAIPNGGFRIFRLFVMSGFDSNLALS